MALTLVQGHVEGENTFYNLFTACLKVVIKKAVSESVFKLFDVKCFRWDEGVYVVWGFLLYNTATEGFMATLHSLS